MASPEPDLICFVIFRKGEILWCILSFEEMALVLSTGLSDNLGKKMVTMVFSINKIREVFSINKIRKVCYLICDTLKKRQ